MKVLTPKVPECAVSIYEDVVTKRVCFSDFIEGCLSALQDLPRKYYVYVPQDEIEGNSIYYPTVNDVRDAKYTHEVWILNEIKVKCIGVIESLDYNWTEKHNTSRGTTTFFHYPYQWIRKYQ